MDDKNLMDFLPRIYNNEISIMETWKAHFDSINVPYKITDHKENNGKPYKKLWKERRV